MIRRLPVLPTIIVLLAVAAMIGLGLWQLQRRDQKDAAIATLSANLTRPPTSFPRMGPVSGDVLFRRSSFHCLRVTGWQTQAGRTADGQSGFAYIAQCATGAEGPGAFVLLGIGNRPDMKLRWTGGTVSGWITQEPDHRSLIARLVGPHVVLRPMLIAAQGQGGLTASAPPKVDDVPNNHLAYAVQWFLFAAVALGVYGIAVWRRLQPK
ncbi:SURF1 family protein [Sphingobium subterraneum]|uniref:SURF1-like protein n=1 Tax=Sphingobium subterraneum TaxID=627688 RepID=A0A841IYA8_9SPHN|nr:SURF1 family protein [Sphingobium subterraneum]MBB6123300.1 cytochrome oxidase assembly protein ShyY1 [Sphingobium subterraneum]